MILLFVYLKQFKFGKTLIYFSNDRGIQRKRDRTRPDFYKSRFEKLLN